MCCSGLDLPVQQQNSRKHKLKAQILADNDSVPVSGDTPGATAGTENQSADE